MQRQTSSGAGNYGDFAHKAEQLFGGHYSDELVENQQLLQLTILVDDTEDILERKSAMEYSASRRVTESLA